MCDTHKMRGCNYEILNTVMCDVISNIKWKKCETATCCLNFDH